MCQFVESVKLENGIFKRLNYHQERVSKALNDFYSTEKAIDLEKYISQQHYPQKGVFKCRIVYDSKIKFIEFVPYNRRDIKTLKLLDTNIGSFHYKFENRSNFNNAFSERGECDDILLVKNGLLTDTTYCNIALYDGSKWYTPRIPLIYGVMRADLLLNNKLEEKDINVKDIKNYKQIALFNAMIEFGELIIETDRVY